MAFIALKRSNHRSNHRALGAEGRIAVEDLGNVQTWVKQKRAYAEKRGVDQATGKFLGKTKGVPRITIADGNALINYWNEQWKNRKQGQPVASGASGRDWTAFREWALFIAGWNARKVTAEEFWHRTFRMATHLDSLGARPSGWALLLEAIDESTPDLPDPPDIGGWLEKMMGIMKWAAVGTVGYFLLRKKT